MEIQDKLLLSFFAVWLSATFAASGQVNRFDIGTESGPSIALFWGNAEPEYYGTYTVGFNAGLSFRYNFNHYVSLGTNLLFDRKGNFFDRTSEEPNGTRLNTRHRNNLDYLTVPIFARYTLRKKVHLLVDVGLYIGYLTRLTVNKVVITKDLSGNETKTESNYAVSGSWYPVDAGMILGVGMAIPVSKNFSVSLLARNLIGLSEARKRGSLQTEKVKNNSTSFVLGVTYSFGLRQKDETTE